MLTASALELKTMIDRQENVLVQSAPGIGRSADLKASLEAIAVNHVDFHASVASAYELLLNPPLQAEVIVIHELSKADITSRLMLNELITKHSMEGLDFPKLKSVIANETVLDGDNLDEALGNRFHSSVTVF